MNVLNILVYMCCIMLVTCSVKETLGNNENSVQAQVIETASLDNDAKDVQDYVLNINTDKFHKPTCKSVSDIKESNRRMYTGTRDDLIYLGFAPCKNCDP